MKALVLAGGVPQIELIKRLKKRGYYIILADYTEHPVAEEYADMFYRESTLDIDKIEHIASVEQVDLIITCCTDQALNTVALVSEKLGLPCYVSKKIGLDVTNKQYMKKKFVDNDISTARFQIIDKYCGCTNFEYPIVVKPVDCNSSKGVIKVFNDRELDEAVRNALKYSRTSRVVIEEYIEGEEISVDLFVQSKVAKILCISVSEKIKDEHKFVIYKGRYPANVSSVVYKQIEIISQKIVEAFDLVNCPMNMQIIVKNEKVYVVEFSARTGGCIKHRLIELASGVDIIDATIDLFENTIPEINPTISDKYIVDEFIYCNKGLYDHMEGLEDCIKEGLLKESYILKTKGSKFDAVNSSGDRIAAIVYVADTYEEYVSQHNKVIERIKVIDVDGNDIMRHDLLPRL